ncbi:MAG: hydrolase [Bacteroidetes bacterium GWA2_30_7]|nr:MAG: hydrolase [Bacteroidetes bacterium GWA2_30_7]
MNRDKALDLLKQYVKNEKMLQHSLASEVVMRALAVKLNQDVEKWGLAGLLHDIDVEITNADAHIHGKKSVEILSKLNADEDIIDAIMMHNEVSAGISRTTQFQHALAAGETITGLIFATTYVYPDKKLSSVKTSSVVKRMKEKNFAATVKRENIMECEKIGIPINEFAEIAINAMKEISNELGL